VDYRCSSNTDSHREFSYGAFLAGQKCASRQGYSERKSRIIILIDS